MIMPSSISMTSPSVQSLRLPKLSNGKEPRRWPKREAHIRIKMAQRPIIGKREDQERGGGNSVREKLVKTKHKSEI